MHIYNVIGIMFFNHGVNALHEFAYAKRCVSAMNFSFRIVIAIAVFQIFTQWTNMHRSVQIDAIIAEDF